MEWADILADPCLQDLPYKIELNQYGQIVMSPASHRHGRIQGLLAALMRQWLPGGAVVTECPVVTPSGVKAADIAWESAAFIARHGDTTPLPAAPEICVEVVSPSNSASAMAEKVSLLLGASAREVWLVSDDGSISFHGPEGVRTGSVYPGVPDWVEV